MDILFQTRDGYGVVRGTIVAPDAYGVLQTQEYISDGAGFRIVGTNLPVAPAAVPAVSLVGPAPVAETAEVAAARAEFETAYAAAAAAAAAAPEEPAAEEEAVVAEERKRREAEDEKAEAVAAAPVYPYAYAALGGLYAAAPSAIVADANLPAAATAINPLAINPLAVGTYAALPPLPGAIPALGAIPAALPAATLPTATYSGIVSAPAAREATLTTIKANPGHAVVYTVA